MIIVQAIGFAIFAGACGFGIVACMAAIVEGFKGTNDV